VNIFVAPRESHEHSEAYAQLKAEVQAHETAAERFFIWRQTEAGFDA
jgi:hypothetical protein